MKFFGTVTILLLALSCGHVRVKHTSTYQKSDGTIIESNYVNSVSKSTLKTWCIITGILYGGACWGYLLSPTSGEEEEIRRETLMQIKQKYGDGNYVLVEELFDKVDYNKAGRAKFNSVASNSNAIKKLDVKKTVQIENKMSETQVTEIFGTPNRVSLSNGLKVYHYNLYGKSVTDIRPHLIIFKDGKVIAHQSDNYEYNRIKKEQNRILAEKLGKEKLDLTEQRNEIEAEKAEAEKMKAAAMASQNRARTSNTSCIQNSLTGNVNCTTTEY